MKERARVMEADARAIVRAAAEEILDEAGRVVGLVMAPARVRLQRKELANGGFLVLERDDETDRYRATEYDALWDKRRQKYYPAGHAFVVWEADSADAAVESLIAYFKANGPPATHDGMPPFGG